MLAVQIQALHTQVDFLPAVYIVAEMYSAEYNHKSNIYHIGIDVTIFWILSDYLIYLY